MITRKNNAFLLIEVLITVVVVTASIISINGAFTSSFKAAALSNDYLGAILLLEDKSFDFEFNPQTEEGKFSGEAEFIGRRFNWMQTIEPLQKEELADEYEQEDLGIKRLEFSLGWKSKDIEREIAILTYIQIPVKEEE